MDETNKAFRSFLRKTLTRAMESGGTSDFRAFKMPLGLDKRRLGEAIEAMQEQSPAFVLSVAAYCPKDFDLSKFDPPKAAIVAAAMMVCVEAGAAESLLIEAQAACAEMPHDTLGKLADRFASEMARREAVEEQEKRKDLPPLEGSQ